MGILDIFRKKKPAEPEPEKIAFSEIENWLNNKAKEAREKEKEILESIKQKISLFTSELNTKVKVLKEIDIESKKVEDRAKIIVKQSLEKYLIYVDIFTKELNQTEKQDLQQFIKDINKIFSDFDKHSYLFYQRATFLIGDQIAAVKQGISNLSQYFTQLFNENQKTINTLEKIPQIQSKFNQLNKIKTTTNKINLEITTTDEKIKTTIEKEKNALQEIEKIKTSQDYLDNLKKQEQTKLAQDQLEKDIKELRKLIDFKKLSSLFHSDEKKMNLIKNYKENFQATFQKDSQNQALLDLLSEAKINTSLIQQKTEQINTKKQEIAKAKNENKEAAQKDPTKTLLKEIEKIKSDITNLNTEKDRLTKRKTNHQQIKNTTITEIKQETESLGGVLVVGIL
ncbi:hypothetical protein CMI37_17375 [Candidatus Pacearchaeota archaeon]|nr:hypothetical protein [Candidatus Pacearchaeota archaeon]|tara:strand:- start:1587 stop:2777 length:1191 start_codon:yes stop_codon:yes gene_type:complete